MSSTSGPANAAASSRNGCPPGRTMAMRQLEPAFTIWPPCSAGTRPQRISDDLPQPDVPTTGEKAVEPQASEQIVDPGLAAEEQVVFVGFERAETRERVGESRCSLTGTARDPRRAARR